jgi:hypothetical protein
MTSSDQIRQDELAAKAREVAARAAVGGNVAKTAFLSTIKGATSVGDKMIVFGSLVGLVAFFLPWATLGPASLSGLGLAKEVNLTWLFPLSMIACFVSCWLLLNASATKHILAARWFIVIGTLWFAPALLSVTNVFSGSAGFGLYVAGGAVAAIMLGGVLQIGTYLKEVRATVPETI